MESRQCEWTVSVRSGGWRRPAVEEASAMGHHNMPPMCTYTQRHRDKQRAAQLQHNTPNGECDNTTTGNVESHPFVLITEKFFICQIWLRINCVHTRMHMHTRELCCTWASSQLSVTVQQPREVIWTNSFSQMKSSMCSTSSRSSCSSLVGMWLSVLIEVLGM